MQDSKNYNLSVFKTNATLSQAAAEFIVALAVKSVSDNSKFSLVLSGGNTPRELYELFAGQTYSIQMPWQHTHVFWGDERCLPLEDERNNAHEAKQILLDKIKIPAENIHVMPVNMHPADAAAAYEQELAVFFKDVPWHFDLILLGLGENGHTASLFPGTKILHEKAKGVRAVYVEEQQMFRITMTAPLINAAATIVFLVSGESKAQILSDVLSDSGQEQYPAQLIRPTGGKLYWFVDEAAAQHISN